MPKGILDTNILIRLFLDDVPSLSDKILNALNNPSSQLILTDITVAEIVWVLKSFYDYPRQEIVKLLEELVLLPTVISNQNLILSALQLYGTLNIDYIDAHIASIARYTELPVYTFDKDYKKIPNIHSLNL